MAKPSGLNSAFAAALRGANSLPVTKGRDAYNRASQLKGEREKHDIKARAYTEQGHPPMGYRTDN